MPLEARLANQQKFSMLGFSDIVHFKSNASLLDRIVPLKLDEAKPPVETKRAGRPKIAETSSELASFREATRWTRETASTRHSRNSREELVKSRLANEAETTRLIAEVTAIESRLEDCNSNLKSLEIREHSDEFSQDINQL
jgi:seryl-tRNA synthetase